MTKTKPIVVEQNFAVSPESLWRAITEHPQMVQWFFENIPAFKPEPGFQTEFLVSTGERDFHHLWTITESIPGSKLVYDWRYQGLPGIGKVTFEIFSVGEGALLRVTNEGLETFPREIPEFTRESCEGGWKYFVQGKLQNYLSKEER